MVEEKQEYRVKMTDRIARTGTSLRSSCPQRAPSLVYTTTMEVLTLGTPGLSENGRFLLGICTFCTCFAKELYVTGTLSIAEMHQGLAFSSSRPDVDST